MMRKLPAFLTLLAIPPVLFAGLFLPAVFFVAIFLCMTIIGSVQIWCLLPGFIKRHYAHASRFVFVSVICMAFFVYSCALLNYYYLSGIEQPDSIASLIVLFLMSSFLCYILTTGRLIKTFIATLLICTASFFIWQEFVADQPLRTSAADSADAANRLMSLPYVAWVPDEENIDKSLVVTDEAEKTYDGLNLFACYQSPTAYLVDMDGRTVNKWESPNGKDEWDYVEMDGRGNLYGDVEYRYLVKLAYDGSVIWKSKGRFHHDFEIDEENGRIYSLTNEYEFLFVDGRPTPVLTDDVVILSSDGRFLESLPLMDMLPKEVLENTWHFGVMYGSLKEYVLTWVKVFSQKIIFKQNFGKVDITHANSIELLKEDIPGFCRKGDLLICARNLDMVGVLDPAKRRFRWIWGQGELDRPHHPTLIENGHLLVFDNGLNRGYSRVLELDPISRKIVWEYKTDPPEDFYSTIMGSNQRLPNGNTLIANSCKGYAFEVTPDGEIVWEFYSPEKDEIKGMRKSMYRFMRITYPLDLPTEN